jgi:UDPglucose--hexose-1-phosphate uridylyltransferase
MGRSVNVMHSAVQIIGPRIHSAANCELLTVNWGSMELRKDPITRSWVLTGEAPDAPQPETAGECPYCPDSTAKLQVVGSMPAIGPAIGPAAGPAAASAMGPGNGANPGAPWSARAVVHPAPVYHIEGDPNRQGNGLYDTMQSIGAHEVLLESPRHDRNLWEASDAEIEQFLRLAAQRIQDLKRDRRFKYVAIFKNHGKLGGQEIAHPHWLLMATGFVPRRVLYELRAGREHYQQKERCVFCDILTQEERQKLRIVETRGDYIACCPYAQRVPYETWVMPRTHEASFERSVLGGDGSVRGAVVKDLAALLRRTLLRIRSITEDFHMVLHTMPNTLRKSNILGYWSTIDDDYHWHFEILPVVRGRSRSYTFKEVYYSDVTSEQAAQRLRAAKV